MIINEVLITNFGPFVIEKIPLAYPVTIVTGQENSGKSSLLLAIEFLFDNSLLHEDIRSYCSSKTHVQINGAHKGKELKAHRSYETEFVTSFCYGGSERCVRTDVFQYIFETRMIFPHTRNINFYNLNINTEDENLFKFLFDHKETVQTMETHLTRYSALVDFTINFTKSVDLQKLARKRRVLEMLWYSKNPRHEILVEGKVLSILRDRETVFRAANQKSFLEQSVVLEEFYVGFCNTGIEMNEHLISIYGKKIEKLDFKLQCLTAEIQCRIKNQEERKTLKLTIDKFYDDWVEAKLNRKRAFIEYLKNCRYDRCNEIYDRYANIDEETRNDAMEKDLQKAIKRRNELKNIENNLKHKDLTKKRKLNRLVRTSDTFIKALDALEVEIIEDARGLRNRHFQRVNWIETEWKNKNKISVLKSATEYYIKDILKQVSPETFEAVKVLARINRSFEDGIEIGLFFKQNRSIQIKFKDKDSAPQICTESDENLKAIIMLYNKSKTNFKVHVGLRPNQGEYEKEFVKTFENQIREILQPSYLMRLLTEWPLIKPSAVANWEELEDFIGIYTKPKFYTDFQNYLCITNLIYDMESTEETDLDPDINIENIFAWMANDNKDKWQQFQSRAEVLRNADSRKINEIEVNRQIMDVIENLHECQLEISYLKKLKKNFVRLERNAQWFYARKEYEMYNRHYKIVTENVLFYLRFSDILPSFTQDLLLKQLDIEKRLLEFIISVHTKLIKVFDEQIVKDSENKQIFIDRMLKCQSKLNNWSLEHDEEESVSIRKKEFPFDYDKENLMLNIYEESVLTRNVDATFFEISKKLEDIKIIHRPFNNIRDIEKLKYSIGCLLDTKSVSNVQFITTLKNLAEKTNEIFQNLMEGTASICFIIQDTRRTLLDLDKMEFTLHALRNAKTTVQFSGKMINWIHLDSHVKQVLCTAVKIAAAICLNGPILLLKDMHWLKEYHDFYFAEQEIKRRFSSKRPDNTINFLQNIIDVCNDNEITMLMEYNGVPNVKYCNIIECKSNGKHSKCTDITEEAITWQELIDLFENLLDLNAKNIV